LEIKIKENGYWMDAFKYNYQYDDYPLEISSCQKRIDEVTAADLQATARKYIDFNNYVYLRLLPEK
jgi:predicted Zn-dependent peptidase